MSRIRLTLKIRKRILNKRMEIRQSKPRNGEGTPPFHASLAPMNAPTPANSNGEDESGASLVDL
jgi:hypothetical protein